MAEALIDLENSILDAVGWPLWALRTIESLCGIIGCLAIVQTFISVRTVSSSTSSPTLSFRLFQFQYLSVYLTVMLADWMQGTNMYTLYAVSSNILSYLFQLDEL
jgi:hypothetical protein